MARIEYPDLSAPTPEVQALIDQIQQERGGRLLNLYRMLLHSPAIAAGWLKLGTGVRYNAALDGATRELAICEVARLTRAEYEWRAHRRLAVNEGISERQLDALPNWQSAADAFDARHRAVLSLTDELTLKVEVADATFDAVRAHYPPSQVVELVATIGFYNMVSRFLVGLQVDLEA